MAVSVFPSIQGESRDGCRMSARTVVVVRFLDAIAIRIVLEVLFQVNGAAVGLAALGR